MISLLQLLRRLIGLTMVIAISLGILISATEVGLASEAIGMTKSTDRLDLSPCAQQIFESNRGGAADHLKASKIRYDKLHAKIQKSITDGNFIHVEDGESDDLWQNILGIMRGLVPTKVFLHGGYWKVREKCAHVMWDYFCAVFGIKKPEILLLHANKKGSFQPFDNAEGNGLLKVEDIEDLKDSSLDLTKEEYKEKVEQAGNSLRETLKNNDFTTIALKTAPAGLVDIIEEFKDKVAIIWTGPVERKPKSSSWVIKYNYYQAPVEGDRLLAMGVPIIITSPWIANARMNAIVDKQFMSAYRALLPKDTSFLPTDLSFPGFKNLANISVGQSAKFSQYIFSLADGLREKMFDLNKTLTKQLQSDKEDIHHQNLSKGDLEKALKKAEDTYFSQTLLAKRWEKLSSLNTEDRIFREFCPVDHAVQVVSDPALKECVGEVVEVEMKRPDPAGDKLAIEVKPKLGSDIFIISQIFSPPLEDQIQHVIDWMAGGEKPKDLLTASSTQTPMGIASEA
ncbi:hypothetical protein PGT21_023222 [Puccinia graminis f. sp. tritici]|uniref:Uncharacterized protein n=1 Tax=Puccinia graminis f. sp. tritici TaxID=56615 RepID=A0A5B0MPF0_PUCGR|nr:hypothetical protein PGT21_023222 [Puccinia graminis f. sp. tritici]KAA1102559.1 hypothetical protein PGTUg99_015674 [Puccinia graminis f. sp. tritici]